MDSFIFVGNKTPSLSQRFYVASRLKKLSKRARVSFYGYRKASNGKYFYLYNTDKKVMCETVLSYMYTKNGIPVPQIGHFEMGHCDFVFDPKTKNLHIKYILVEPKYRGHHVGDGMLDYVKNMANRMGAKTITLDRLCTFTDGERIAVLTDSKVSVEEVEELKKSGKHVVDKNEKFYLKHGFVKQFGREPQSPYLVPMVLPKIKPTIPEIDTTGKVYRLSRLRRTDRLKAKTYRTNGNTILHSQNLVKNKPLDARKLI